MAIVQDRKIEFSQPVRQVVLMIVVLALVGIGVFFLLGHILAVFDANVWLNGFILAVFLVGVLACFWQVLALVAAVNWLEGFAVDRPGHEFVNPPRLLTSLASLLREIDRACAVIPGLDPLEQSASASAVASQFRTPSTRASIGCWERWP